MESTSSGVVVGSTSTTTSATTSNSAITGVPQERSTKKKTTTTMLALLSSSTRQVTFHFPGEEEWHEALGRVRWSATVALRGWHTSGSDDDTPSAGGSGAPMTLLVAADSMPPMPLVDEDSGAGGVTVHYYDELLKSALQKAVRRRLPWPAARLAYQLLLQSPDECLRRLPVIVMEDGLAHPRLPFLVWLMIAHSKGWPLGLQHVLDVVQVVYELASCEWRDTIPSKGAACGNPFATHEAVRGDQDMRGLVASILLRSCYGGMKGDIRFLRAFAHTWHQRFLRHPDAWREVLREAYGGFKGNEVRLYYYSNRNPDEKPLHHKEERADELASSNTDEVADIAILHAQDMLKEGVDMHCHPKIIDQLAEAGEIMRRGITPEQIRSAIWHRRSGVNHKRLVCLGLHSMAITACPDDADESGYIAPPSLNCTELHLPTEFDIAAHDLTAVWEVVEPELDRLVREGGFWKPRPRPAPSAGADTKRAKKKVRGAEAGLAQPTLAFFQAKPPAPNDRRSSPPPSTSKTQGQTATVGAAESPSRSPAKGAKRKRAGPSPSGSSQTALTSFFRPT